MLKPNMYSLLLVISLSLGFYFPYLNQMHYNSPLIWLQFRNLTPGVLIQIRSPVTSRSQCLDSCV